MLNLTPKRSSKPRLRFLDTACQNVSKAVWKTATTPAPSEKKPVEVGSKADRVAFQNMDQAAAATEALSYHPLDAFVASVAGGVSANAIAEPDAEDKEIVNLTVEDYYAEPVPVQLGLHNGPDAPMLVIFPGIYGGTDNGFQAAYKKIALERGMNYTVFPNPVNYDLVDNSRPVNHPGNQQVEAEAIHKMIDQLREQKPEFFQEVSLTGYSYGGLMAANVARIDEAKGGDRLVTGGIVALSPPENLYNSMRELDGLREDYATGAGSTTWTGIHYTNEVGRLGYENFMESDLASRGEGTNITEIKIADSYGSRDGMINMVAQVDSDFGHNQLPPVWPRYFERKRVLNAMTYEQYSADWMSKDAWLVERGLSPEALGEKTSFKTALDALNDTPVLTLLSQDDYILSQEDVQTFRDIDTDPDDLEYTRVMEHGGHVGLLFNPEVQNLIGDFAYSAKEIRKGQAAET